MPANLCLPPATGQVLCSNVVPELCAGETFEFEAPREPELKRFDEPVALYEATARLQVTGRSTQERSSRSSNGSA